MNVLSEQQPAVKQAQWLVILFLLALGIRLVVGFTSMGLPEGDAAEYDRLAMGLVRGEGFVSPQGSPTSARPPLYPFLLAALYGVFGHSYHAVVVVQAFLGAMTCVLIGLIGVRLFSVPVGILAGGL